MSHWDGHRIVRWPSEPVEGYPGWTRIDCGCCAGIEWGGEQPRECNRCGESGTLVRHDASGVLALWPGGPLRGRELIA
ncbi:MAG TPA: hypothetical protein VH541_05485 [Gaiellaceae bacterium]